MQSLSDIRKAFLDFFKQTEHAILPSAPLVPHNDPTLMFVNAGMVQFKNVFTGAEKLPHQRVTTCQKCVRAGGKHNDLDNVGYTARHHTFFEMLGNFSFGDYFKEGAIKYAWEFLTRELGFSPEKLWVTVYHTDDEAFSLWKSISGLPDSKIVRIETNDNFWSMGEIGPCGPCSEIFYEHDGVKGGELGSGEEGDRFIEIWNLVFMQYDKLEDGSQIDLPKPCIDTGMGLERMTAVMQGVKDNYDIDLFRLLIAKSKGFSGNSGHEVSHRVIADHLRSSCFLIADGVLPSSEGRGYVLRRIMRRAMRHAHHLGCKEPLMYKLVPELTQLMGSHYQELVRAESLIIETLKLEEGRFKETLDKGLKLLEEEASNLDKGGVLEGDIAFKLYDTYGFPLDLTEDILRPRGMQVDNEGFNRAMKRQREKAKAAWAGSGAEATEKIWLDLRTEFEPTEFLRYEMESAQGKVLAIIKDGTQNEEAVEGEEIAVIVNQTPFYAESGGQVGDTGIISTKDLEVRVTDTKKSSDLHIHIGKVIKGKMRSGDIVELKINMERRAKLRANHSATHILHKVLQDILGKHVTQKGSLVTEGKLRFDISHPKAITRPQIIEIETKVNQLIRQNTEVGTRLMSYDEALDSGAMALFGEKYGDEVRVVNMGESDSGRDFSVELCGGTHVKRTGDIGYFKVTLETAVGSGVRRIEAITGSEAVKYAQDQEQALLSISEKLKISPAEIEEKVEKLINDKKKLEKEIGELRKTAAIQGGGENGNSSGKKEEVEEINGIRFVGKILDNLPPKEIKPLIDEIKKQIGSGIVVVISTFGDKVSLVAGVTHDLTDKISAIDLVRAGSEIVGGKGGGGRPDMAQAGGSDTNKAEEVLSKIRGMV